MNFTLMENFKGFINKNKIFLLIILLISIFRLVIGLNFPISISMVSPLDDLLFIQYADIINHFNHWNIYSLVKNMGYPLFLAFVNVSKISYKFWLSLMWVVSGFLVIFGINKYLTKNRILLVLIFIFIVFSPIAFDSWSGSRVYRNSIMAPSAIIFLSSLFIFFNNMVMEPNNRKVNIFWAIISGLTFSFNFFIKEDSITTLPIFIACIGFVLIFLIYNQRKNKNLSINKFVQIFIITLIPLIIFSVSAVAYEEVNMHYFGIHEINTRTDGEIGAFWKNLLLIDDPNKTNDIWCPVSTIKMAGNASPTLQKYYRLTDDWLHSDLAQGDMEKNPLKGDLVTWALRMSMGNVGLFKNESMANGFFKQVNSELENSFDNGTLNKSQKIFITNSLDGKNFDDIEQHVLPYFILGIKECLFYKDLTVGKYPIVASHKQLNDIQKVLNTKIKNVDENSSLLEQFSLEFGKLDILFYQTISYFVVLLSAISFIGILLYQIKNKFEDKVIDIVLFFLIFVIGTFIVQVFAIAWFCVWIELSPGLIMEFYTVSNQGFIALFEVLSISTVFYILNKNNVFKRIPFMSD